MMDDGSWVMMMDDDEELWGGEAPSRGGEGLKPSQGAPIE